MVVVLLQRLHRVMDVPKGTWITSAGSDRRVAVLQTIPVPGCNGFPVTESSSAAMAEARCRAESTGTKLRPNQLPPARDTSR